MDIQTTSGNSYFELPLMISIYSIICRFRWLLTLFVKRPINIQPMTALAAENIVMQDWSFYTP